MEFTLEVETYAGRIVAAELFGRPSAGAKTSLPGGAVLKLTACEETRSAGPLGPVDLLQLTLSIPVGVAASLIANWLYDKLTAGGKRGLVRKLRIDRTEIQFDKGRIERFINERIESDR